MAASRSSRVTRSSVGLNGLDENFCGRTLRNRSIAQPEETSVSPLPRARSPKKKQESKQDSKQEAKQESKQDAKQEVKQESKQETKHDSKHDCQQHSKQESSLQGKVTDSNAFLTEAEHWSSSRKRGVSCLEKDITPEKSDIYDGGKGAQDASPQIKRTKRCSRSGESQGHEEDSEPLKFESLESVPEPSKDNSCEEFPSQNSANAAPASPVLSKEEGEVTVAKAEGGHVEHEGTSRSPVALKTSNGLRDCKAEELSTLNKEPDANPTSVTNCPSLLNGSQMGAPSSPDSTVPCRNSVPGQLEVSGTGESPASSVPTLEVVPDYPVPELIVAKEQEVEVDVVGDPLCLAHEEQVTESESDANGRPLIPVQEVAASTSSTALNVNNSPINNSNSGETTPPLATTPSPTESGCNPSISSTPPSFTELYEHRYTLRTSPRRPATGGKSSSSKPTSPPRDNGPLREEEGLLVGLEEDCAMVEEPAPSDCLGPSSEEPVSIDPGDMAGIELPVDGKDTQSSKELTPSQTAEEEEEEDEPDVYYFESDHLALKHNKDYQRLLQTIGVLEAQRTQAILDLETLARNQQEALTDPIDFVEQLQKRVNLGLPCPQRVVQLPDIAWEQYTSGLGEFEREFCDKKRKTRRLKLIFDKGLPLRPKSPLEPKKEGESSTMYSPLPTSDAPENGRQTQMIRGRICHPNKPDTFNQLWTVEEQKKLEQLLVKFPPEEVESRRWQKIADELGNRTAKQVASRVQKYFIKLTKAGIPVPGRTPNLCMYTKKASSKRQHHLNKHLYRPSTFLTSYEPPVFMDDDDERAAYYSGVQDPSADESDEETVPVELRNLPEYKELLELKRLKKQKLQEIREDKVGVRHLGFKCDVCGMEPIQGVRWHCQDCPQDNSVDFCSNCSDCLFKTETHKPNHHLEPVYQPETFLDRDYCLPQSTGYNYLDPNYFPANR
ncbi:ZZ-type zinc finger-containing protein 3 isoform X1 [Betta splendens]|uniref:ZZ-type zinc finger-containing protein 3 n=1 Tax=Betta splendens TaxID=158456 RepID=A0A6P7KY26_BETSP|nr:ZZ-type zinc finger-containing protein 3 isoform X1 [Betta splendens]XP_028987356.1 ZZ-type zinc finger-containing protein 3 isoform X1 [Betta splendens]XP_028987357.1 ZZ-type zinc finger-containing protein 3 isoform X1 [Betta splendens]XP_028987358.1 ZZ-type zinc finger-containing protein 3 isoform X1 [Betta splendens]